MFTIPIPIPESVLKWGHLKRILISIKLDLSFEKSFVFKKKLILRAINLSDSNNFIQKYFWEIHDSNYM